MTATAPLNATVVTTPAPREIHIERIVNAPRERVWRAYTDPVQVAQWWGQGHCVALVIEKLEAVRGGRWRFVQTTAQGPMGFEGKYREVTPPERIVRSFEWDGMPAHVIIETTIFHDLGDGRTNIVTTMLFHTTEERDGMLQSGLERGMDASYTALDVFLTRVG